MGQLREAVLARPGRPDRRRAVAAGIQQVPIPDTGAFERDPAELTESLREAITGQAALSAPFYLRLLVTADPIDVTFSQRAVAAAAAAARAGVFRDRAPLGRS